MSSKVGSSQTMRALESFRPMVRFDLEWIHYPAQLNWVAHDPLSGDFFRFNEYEYTAVQMMDGSRSIQEVLLQLKAKFGRIQIDAEWMQALVHRMQSSLLLQPTRATLKWFENRQTQMRNQQVWQILLSPLSIRIPLFDPGRMLEWLFIPARILFSRTLAVLSSILAILVVFLVARWAMVHGLPTLNPHQVTIDRWVMLLVCYAAVKSLHEFGHMLACSRYKVRSTEVGILLLCLTPCFYCDTTDAWKLPSKWQRALISAAGIYVELLIAMFASVLWLFLNDGTLNLICVNLMLICSISTVFVNANPLLRYDGYYILSDLWGVPNLHDQSKIAFKHLFARWVLLQRVRPIALDANIYLLAIFSIASWIYRVFVMAAILWLVWTFLPPIGLELVSYAVTASIVLGMVIAQKRSISSTFRSLRLMSGTSRIISVAISLGLLAGIIAILFIPFPRHIAARGYVEYEDKVPIYASYDARIKSVSDKFTPVKSGEAIVQLESPVAELELVKLEGERAQVENEIAQLKLRRTIDPDSEYRIPQLEADLQQITARLAVLRTESRQLTFIAPTDGYLIDALSGPKTELSAIAESRFKPTIIDQENSNAWLRRSELLGWFSQFHKPVLVALVPEHELRGLQVGMTAKIRRDCDPFNPIEGKVTRIAPDKVEKVPEPLLGDQSLVAIPNAQGYYEPEFPHYEVTIAVPSDSYMLYSSLGTASIELETLPIYQHITDFVRRTIRPITK